MKIIITENRLTNLINQTLGYDLSDTIKMVTDWESDINIRRMFKKDKEYFDMLLYNWGPMYWINTPNDGKWLVQQVGDNHWSMIEAGIDLNIRRPDRPLAGVESQLLSYMGVSMFGIPLKTIIDNFVKEE